MIQDELRALVDEAMALDAKATKGPWESVTVLPAGTDGDRAWSESPWRTINGPPQEIHDYMLARRAFAKPEDGDFIARARTLLPRLAAVVKVLVEHGYPSDYTYDLSRALRGEK